MGHPIHGHDGLVGTDGIQGPILGTLHYAGKPTWIRQSRRALHEASVVRKASLLTLRVRKKRLRARVLAVTE